MKKLFVFIASPSILFVAYLLYISNVRDVENLLSVKMDFYLLFIVLGLISIYVYEMLEYIYELYFKPSPEIRISTDHNGNVTYSIYPRDLNTPCYRIFRHKKSGSVKLTTGLWDEVCTTGYLTVPYYKTKDVCPWCKSKETQTIDVPGSGIGHSAIVDGERINCSGTIKRAKKVFICKGCDYEGELIVLEKCDELFSTEVKGTKDKGGQLSNDKVNGTFIAMYGEKRLEDSAVGRLANFRERLEDDHVTND